MDFLNTFFEIKEENYNFITTEDDDKIKVESVSYENEKINLSHNNIYNKLYNLPPNLHNSDITRTKTSSLQSGTESNIVSM